MSFISKLLQIGSTPDWISPAIGIIQEASRDSRPINFAGISVNEAKRRLRRAGIRYWNDYIDWNDTGWISVAPEDEARAKKLL